MNLHRRIIVFNVIFLICSQLFICCVKAETCRGKNKLDSAKLLNAKDECVQNAIIESQQGNSLKASDVTLRKILR